MGLLNVLVEHKQHISFLCISAFAFFLSLFLSVCLSVRLSVRLSVCLPSYLLFSLLLSLPISPPLSFSSLCAHGCLLKNNFLIIFLFLSLSLSLSLPLSLYLKNECIQSGYRQTPLERIDRCSSENFLLFVDIV